LFEIYVQAAKGNAYLGFKASLVFASTRFGSILGMPVSSASLPVAPQYYQLKKRELTGYEICACGAVVQIFELAR
jgi:hypothetical protein